MKRSEVSFETVRRVGGALPGVEESTAYGMPALKVGKKMLAAVPTNRSVEANSLVVRVSAEQRDELVAMEPGVYYLTAHYEGYDAVLVRLSRVNEEALKGLRVMAHRYVTRGGRGAAKAKRGSPRG
jgi:hypothetical protein